MKRHLLLAFAMAVFMSMADEISVTYNAPRNQTRAEILWTRPICVETNRYVGWPTVTRLKNGDLVVVFSGDRDAHVCPWGKVQFIRSKDGGETWSAPQTIANGPIDDRDAGLVELPDGELLVVYFTSIAYRTKRLLEGQWGPQTRQYWWVRHDEKLSDEVRQSALGNFCVRSRDGGVTWSKPEKMSMKGQTPHGPILLRDGSLFQIGKVDKPPTPSYMSIDPKIRTGITAERSTDGGRTWELLCQNIPAPPDDPPKMVYCEPNAVELSDGTIIGLVRYHGPDNCLRQAVSRDGGRTWTPMKATTLKGLPPHLIRLADGKVVVVYGRRLADPGFGEFATISDDGGKTWDSANEICLAPSHNGDLGYPSTCLLPSGDLLTVYYQQQRPARGELPCIMATKWKVGERK